ncbi:Chromatin modification- protein meaf6 [Quaeritorhiza haematococci]|nr:Chromatin modification- protein meaf6 [Quaeritorhiza haematococci]
MPGATTKGNNTSATPTAGGAGATTAVGSNAGNAAAGSSKADAQENSQITANQLAEAEAELSQLLNKKRQLDRGLISIENNIYAFEGSYLEDTQQLGNIIKGFDNYLNNRNDKKRQKFSESDRLFSNSSTTFLKALEYKQREEQQHTSEEENFRYGSGSEKLKSARKKKKEEASSSQKANKRLRVISPSEEEEE